jgi:hypothetical protein
VVASQYVRRVSQCAWECVVRSVHHLIQAYLLGRCQLSLLLALVVCSAIATLDMAKYAAVRSGRVTVCAPSVAVRVASIRLLP